MKKDLFFSIQNSTNGGGMDFNNQVKQNGNAWSIVLHKNGSFEFVSEFVI